MMRLRRGGVQLSFCADDYSRESLQAAARLLPEDVSFALERRGRELRVELRPGRVSPTRLRALAGSFTDAALNHAYRQQVVRLHSRLSSAVLSRILERAFKPVPPDPLEELEPQVREDRNKDVAALLVAARRLGGA